MARDPMTPDDIAKARALCEAVPAGPYRAERRGRRAIIRNAAGAVVLDVEGEFASGVLRLATDSRVLLPAALDEVDRLLTRAESAEAERDRLRALMEGAFEIIDEVAPGHTVWLDAAQAELWPAMIAADAAQGGDGA